MKLDTITKYQLLKICEAFSDYKFENDEKGLYYLCKGRDGRIRFVKGYALFCILSGWLNTCSYKKEGYICIQESCDRISARGMIKFYYGIIAGMGLFGGIKFGINFIRAGKPINQLLKKSGYVHIRMLVIGKGYQGMGYMRNLVEIAFDRAREKNVPCIVSTDSMDKAKKYEHLGFKIYQIRRLAEHSSEYDMIWYK